MRAEYIDGNVRARCPDCAGTITTFEYKGSGNEFGTIIIDKHHVFKGESFNRILYKLLRCAGCGRGGIATIHDKGRVVDGVLEAFYPVSVENVKISSQVPEKIVAEFRQAELCASFGAWRAASAMLRSALEKTLNESGYIKGTLKDKIDKAAADAVITDARRKRAHQDIRVLGNDVLHDEWREVEEEEVNASHHYTQRILEDFYDERESVEQILKEKGRIKPESEESEK
jgi:hypothetical protein